MQFPRLVYRSATEYELADDKEQFDQFLKDGWFASVPEAIVGKHDIATEAAPPTRSELENKAKDLGIKFTERTKDAKLLQLITEALEA
jgi:hypothetical protein